MAEQIFPEGIRLWEPRENAPTFVKGSITVHPETLTAWAAQYLDEKGYIRLDLKEGRNGKLYLALNTYKTSAEKPSALKEELERDRNSIDYPKDDINPDDIPF